MLAFYLYLIALEDDLWMMLDIKKVRAPQVIFTSTEESRGLSGSNSSEP
jgi:hypothetical protein